MNKFSSPFMAKSPLHDGGKWGTRSPGTGWSQKEKLADPKGHSKAVKKGLKNLPAMALAGLSTITGATPIIAGATGVAAGIAALRNLFPSKKHKIQK